jgi:hypothetical protein
VGDEEKLLLPEGDREFLLEKYPDYDVLKNGSELHVIFPAFDFPAAYAPRKADLLIIVPAGYPNAPLDMFWTCPDVMLSTGGWPNACTHHETYHGKSWQRWSRHFFQDKPWRPGIDSLRTFMATVRAEIAKGA